MAWGAGARGESCPWEVLGLELKQTEQRPEELMKGGRQRGLKGEGRGPRGTREWEQEETMGRGGVEGEEAGWGDFAEGGKQNSNHARDERQAGSTRRGRKARVERTGEKASEVGRRTQRREGLRRRAAGGRAQRRRPGRPLTLSPLLPSQAAPSSPTASVSQR